MPNTINYAESWNPGLLTATIQGTLTSAHITSNVAWEGARTFHFTAMSTSGYRNHTAGGKIKRGVLTQTDVPFSFTHDRSIAFLVDKSEVQDSHYTADIQKVAERFQRTKGAPEVDALFFETVAQKAKAANLYDETAIGTINKTNVFEKLKGALSKVKRYRGSLICYVKTPVMDALELALADKAKIEWTSISGLEFSIETRVAKLDGVVIIEVIYDDRFYTKFDYLDTEQGGFTPNGAGKPINFLFASTETCLTVKRIQSIYINAPGTHTEGDGWYFQMRDNWDTFVLPNGKDGKVDSCYVSYDNSEAA